jgi:hypothetical protein
LEEGITITKGLGGSNLLVKGTHTKKVFEKVKNRAANF